MAALDLSLPADEAGRLAAVRRFEILDTPPDAALDRITALAARLFGVPIALVSIVDSDRIWFKSRYGLSGVEQVERLPGLCASAILENQPWVVTDAEHDPRTAANPLVAGPFGLRFYAGVPLTTSARHNIGVLCVVDHQPREVTEDEIQTLGALGQLVMDQLELRLHSHELVSAEGDLRREAERLADVLQASLLPPRPPTVPAMEVASRFVAGEQGMRVGGDFYDVFRRQSNDWAIILGDVCGKGAAAAAVAAAARWTVRASAGHHAAHPSHVLRDLNATLLADHAGDGHYLSAVFARLELDTCGAWLTLAASGHPLPVLVRRSGRVQLRGQPSLPLGMFEEIDPVEDRVGLGPGDALVFYTDGVTDARDTAGQLFGETRLLRLLANCTGQPAEQIATAVVDAVQAFRSDVAADDLAVLVVRVPDDAAEAPLQRVAEATGVPAEDLRLPGYPHGDPPDLPYITREQIRET